jgi:hypothetical protein
MNFESLCNNLLDIKVLFYKIIEKVIHHKSEIFNLSVYSNNFNIFIMSRCFDIITTLVVEIIYFFLYVLLIDVIPLHMP